MRLTVIGAGPGGYTAAFEAARRGMEVTLIDREAPGGVCLHRGCIPTKTIRASADALNLARSLTEYGVSACPSPVLEREAALRRKEKVISVLEGGLEKTCASLNVKLLRGKACIRNAGSVMVESQSGPGEISGDAIIIATGSKMLELPGLPFDHEYICGSDDALELKKIPGSIAIVGGGVIGCEMACIYQSFGSQVTVIEGQDRLLPIPGVDRDISDLLAREMKKRKIRAVTGKTLQNVHVQDGAVLGELAPSPFAANAGATQAPAPVEAEMVLVTVGRAPATDGLGLAEAGIGLDRRGWIRVDDRLRTSVPGIYAIGDCLGPSHIMLAHVASAEAISAVADLCGEKLPMRYDTVPSAIFTTPEIGVAGLSEAQAKEKFPNVVCGMTQMRELGKAQAMGELPGFFKIVADGDTGLVLGAQIAGAHASDLVAEAGLALSAALTVKQLAETVHAHPTLAEGLADAARAAMRKLA